ncbi:hypothetical protein LTR22_027701 [Elasticomyces elasticus]|nr:hypothetical protein LTR22_027701 [Elasticomyces elasticus]
MPVASLSWKSTYSDLIQASEQDIITYCAAAPAISSNVFHVRRLTEQAVVKIGMEIEGEYEGQLLVWELVGGGQLRVPKPLRFVRRIDEDGITFGYFIMEYLQGSTLENCDLSHHYETAAKVAKAVHLLHTKTAGILGHNRPGPPLGGLAKGFPWGEHGADIEFSSVDDLETCIRKRLKHYARYEANLGWSTSAIDLRDETLVFCHLDLAPRNILLADDGSIGLLDWGTLAYYPVAFELAAILHQRTNVDLAHDLYYAELVQHLRKLESPTGEEILDKLELTQMGSIRHAY